MDNHIENQTETAKENKAPDYRLSLVKQTPGGDQWASIGVGWTHNDGEGITFSPDILKLYGLKLVARKIK